MGDPSFEISTDGLEEGLNRLLELKRTVDDDTQRVLGRVAGQLADAVEEMLLDNERWSDADATVTYSKTEDDVLEIAVHGDGVYELEWGGGEIIKSPLLLTSLDKAARHADRAVTIGLSNLFDTKDPNGGVRGVKAQEWHGV